MGKNQIIPVLPGGKHEANGLFSEKIHSTADSAIIVLFGGLAKAGDYIMKPVREAMEENVLRLWKGKVKLLFSSLKEAYAAVLGASALGWDVEE